MVIECLFAVCNDVITNEFIREMHRNRIWRLLFKTQDDIDIGWIISFFTWFLPAFVNRTREIQFKLKFSKCFQWHFHFEFIQNHNDNLYYIDRGCGKCLEFTFVQNNKIKAFHVICTRIFLFPFSHHIIFVHGIRLASYVLYDTGCILCLNAE